MFDFSLAELGVAGVVALLVLGPQDMVALLRTFRKATAKIKEYFDEYTGFINEAVNEIEEEAVISDTIIDLEGKAQKTYDLSKIMPDFKEDSAEEQPKPKVAND